MINESLHSAILSPRQGHSYEAGFEDKSGTGVYIPVPEAGE